MYMYVRVHEYEVDCKVIRMAPHNKYHDVSAQTPQYVYYTLQNPARAATAGVARPERGGGGEGEGHEGQEAEHDAGGAAAAARRPRREAHLRRPLQRRHQHRQDGACVRSREAMYFSVLPLFCDIIPCFKLALFVLYTIHCLER